MRRTLLIVALSLALVGAGCGGSGDGGRTPAAIPTVGTRVGDRAPDFTIRTVGGQTIRLADFLGKKALVITSTATWCSTCVYEAEQLAPVYAEFRDRVEFLSVSIDPSEDALAIEAFRVNLNTPWFYALATAAGVPELIRAYDFRRFEITYVIDQDGIIQFSDQQITTSEMLRQVLRRVTAAAS